MFLTIKKIPKNTWSSKKPLNFKPKFLTSFFLCLGLVFFGLGEGLLIVSTTGNSPWSVLAEGISINLKVSIGIVTFFISVFVLILWFFLNQKPGIKTLLNIIIIIISISLNNDLYYIIYTNSIMNERYKATMTLHALGDTIGFKNGDWEFNNAHKRKLGTVEINSSYTNELLYEFISLGGINHLDTKDWIVSDDTILHIATARAVLKEDKDLDKLGNYLKDEYILAFKDMKDRYPGDNTYKYINKLKSGLEWDKVPYDNYAGGSGAAMRTSCLGLVYHGKKNRKILVTYALEASRITHNCVTGYLGGITSALFTAFAIENIKIELWIDELLKILESNLIDKYLEETRGYEQYVIEKDPFIIKWKELKNDLFMADGIKIKNNKLSKNLEWRGIYFAENYQDDRFKNIGFIGGSGDDSVIIAYSALLHSKNNWEKLVIYSMLHIGDTDTTGCIAASWYGALYGFEDIPQHYIDNLEYSKDIESLGTKLYNKFYK